MTATQAARAEGIDPRTADTGGDDQPQPFNHESFERLGVLEAWRRYGQYLTWGRGQCLAILDDGCDISRPAWQAQMPWGPKVIATWNAVDGNANCAHQGRGYHGTTVGYPSSMNDAGVRGVAFNNFVAHVRCCTVVHLPTMEDATIAAGLQWVLDNYQRLNITTINLAPVDNIPHDGLVPSAIDAKLRELRQRNIWVSSPTANNDHITGISWPACAKSCFAIGGVHPDTLQPFRDRYHNVDLLACARATSSSNAYAAACAMTVREAIEVTRYPWQQVAPTLPEAIMAIFQDTGVPQHDAATGLHFRELNLTRALQHIFGV